MAGPAHVYIPSLHQAAPTSLDLAQTIVLPSPGNVPWNLALQLLECRSCSTLSDSALVNPRLGRHSGCHNGILAAGLEAPAPVAGPAQLQAIL